MGLASSSTTKLCKLHHGKFLTVQVSFVYCQVMSYPNLITVETLTFSFWWIMGLRRNVLLPIYRRNHNYLIMCCSWPPLSFIDQMTSTFCNKRRNQLCHFDKWGICHYLFETFLKRPNNSNKKLKCTSWYFTCARQVSWNRHIFALKKGKDVCCKAFLNIEFCFLTPIFFGLSWNEFVTE